MTNIRIAKEVAENEVRYEIAVVGHVGYAEIGKDIVCSAISILVQTLENVLTNGKYRLKNKMDMGPGIVMGAFSWLKDSEDAERIEAVLDTIESGLQMIAEEYPEYVIYDKIKS